VSRRLGQHFLRDPATLDRIVDALNPGPDDLVLEIGPGEGTLTRRLAPRVRHVVAIEKDRRCSSGPWPIALSRLATAPTAGGRTTLGRCTRIPLRQDWIGRP
jgi:hypothetical protein